MSPGDLFLGFVGLCAVASIGLMLARLIWQLGDFQPRTNDVNVSVTVVAPPAPPSDYVPSARPQPAGVVLTPAQLDGLRQMARTVDALAFDVATLKANPPTMTGREFLMQLPPPVSRDDLD